jgi:hypothetical protein
MARQQFKAEKRRKELARLRKNEEKRQKRAERKRARQAGEDPLAPSSPPMEGSEPGAPV